MDHTNFYATFSEINCFFLFFNLRMEELISTNSDTKDKPLIR